MNRVARVICSLGILLSGCSTHSSSNSDLEHCLYASIAAYPTWNVKNGPVLEALSECKSLSIEDRTRLRSMVADFAAAGNR